MSIRSGKCAESVPSFRMCMYKRRKNRKARPLVICFAAYGYPNSRSISLEPGSVSIFQGAFITEMYNWRAWGPGNKRHLQTRPCEMKGNQQPLRRLAPGPQRFWIICEHPIISKPSAIWVAIVTRSTSLNSCLGKGPVCPRASRVNFSKGTRTGQKRPHIKLLQVKLPAGFTTITP